MQPRLGIAVALLIAAQAVSAVAQDTVKLFKIITPKDEVVIGLTGDELRALGPGPELDNLAKHLVSDGQMTVWRYAVRKDPSGNLQQAPLQRIAIFKTDTLRIEAYSTPFPIVPVGK